MNSEAFTSEFIDNLEEMFPRYYTDVFDRCVCVCLYMCMFVYVNVCVCICVYVCLTTTIK